MPLTQVTSRLIEDTLRYVLGASGTDHYTFTGKGLNGAVNDPTLYLNRGHTYIFENRNASGQHPFYIKTSIANGGTNDQYSTGVTNNGGAGGTEIVFTVPHDAPDLLYYQCSSHINMAGQFKISGSVSDGSITEGKLASNAVTTVKIADDAVTAPKIADGQVTTAKIGANQVTSAKIAPANVTTTQIADDAITTAKIAAGAVDRTEIAANAIATEKIDNAQVTTAKIADLAISTSKLADEAVTLAKLEHGTSSNDGKFLRANNGADPSFETITVPVGIPSGGIIIWSGAANAIPSGFVLCDGNNSTPNLRNRFIVGAGDSYNVNATGGATTDSITVSISGNTGGPSATSADGMGLGNQMPTNNHTHSFSGSGSATVDTLPPYYALCYIMKT